MDTIRSKDALTLTPTSTELLTASQSAEYTGIVVNHTHWDREWYMPFQRYRVLLVDAIDHLLQILQERSDYVNFTLDGQTVMVEDYLEVRPDMRQTLGDFVRSGRVGLGPWY